MARLLDPKKHGQKKFPFEYRNAATTDVRITWNKAREQMKQNAEEVKLKVKPIVRLKP